MQLLFIVCESGVDERLMRLVEEVGAPGYTRFTGATGHSGAGRREGTAVWPGMNSILMVFTPEETVPAIHAAIERLKADRGGRLAIKIFSVPAEEAF